MMSNVHTMEELGKAVGEARKRGDKPIEVNCIGREFRNLHASWQAEVWNPKIEQWMPEMILQYEDACPICLKLMLVRAIQGSSWLACCSKECTDKYITIHKRHFNG